MKYLYQFLGWLFGGVEINAIIWPDLPTFTIIVAGGLIEFIIYRLFMNWLEREYGTPYLFFYFFLSPIIHGVLPDSPVGIRIIETKERYDARFRHK